ncbi:MAG: peptidylprolyl isomerase [Clostridia bacterium]|nr:peptidylprolyl isomerase [Clostridia bacterium]
MRRRSKGFFSDRRRLIAVIVAGALLLAGLLLLILKLADRKADEEPDPNPVATITMSDGAQMRFELYPDQAPNTVANFIRLANRGFYSNQQFYRIVAGVFIEGGDPQNNGTGGPGYAIRGEFAENGFTGNNVSHLRGAISMARQSGYDTAGSQFFIMQGSYPEYDGKYAAFGSAADAQTLTVLDAIASQPTDSTYLPLTRQVIRSIHVETFGVDYGDPETIEGE